MKKVVFLLKHPYGEAGFPFSSDEVVERYRQLSLSANERQIKIAVSFLDAYKGAMQFEYTYAFNEQNQLVRENVQCAADLVYVKAAHVAEHIDSTDVVGTDLHLEAINDDKWKMYTLLSDFMPKTYQISGENWREVLNEIKTDLIVCKPVDGSSGEGLTILPREDFSFQAVTDDQHKYIAQDFLDSSEGVPGFGRGLHDMRIIMFNDKPLLSLIRMAPPGSKLANISLGARPIIIDIANVPADAMELARRVDQRFAAYYPRLYTVDIMYSGGRPYLAEINTAPAIPSADIHGKKYQEAFHHAMLDFFEDILSKR